MATIADVGVPGQPLGSPSLTAWQAAVRDALTPILGALTPRAGWADYGAGFGGMQVTRFGPLVTITALLKPTADTALTAGTAVSVADIANTALRPIGANVAGPGVLQLTGSSGPVATRVTVTTAGLVTVIPSSSGTIVASSGLLSINLTYRGA